MSTLLAVSLRGMRFHTLVGILPHERGLPQPLEIDITAWVAEIPGTPAPLDYRELYRMVATAVEAGTHYLEELARALVEGALALPPVERVEVAVRKPHVAMPGPLAYAEVRMERSRRHG